MHDLTLAAENKTATIVQPATAYIFGQQVEQQITDDGGYQYYVCILAFTTADPLVQPSDDPTHWVLTSKKNQVFVQNMGDYNKFFGIVDPNVQVKFTVSEQSGVTKFYNNHSFFGNQNFFTDIFWNTLLQSAQDNNITLLNKDYEFIDGVYNSSVALTAAGETLVGTYLYVLLQKNMRLNGNPTISVNEYIYLLQVLTQTVKSY